jgi:hypothetical protein
VQERELRLREYMRVLGMLDAAYWGSWFATHITILMVSGLLCALIGQCASPLFSLRKRPTQCGLHYFRSAHTTCVMYSLATLDTFVAQLLCCFRPQTSHQRMPLCLSSIVYAFISGGM